MSVEIRGREGLDAERGLQLFELLSIVFDLLVDDASAGGVLLTDHLRQNMVERTRPGFSGKAATAAASRRTG